MLARKAHEERKRAVENASNSQVNVNERKGIQVRQERRCEGGWKCRQSHAGVKQKR